MLSSTVPGVGKALNRCLFVLAGPGGAVEDIAGDTEDSLLACRAVGGAVMTVR